MKVFLAILCAAVCSAVSPPYLKRGGYKLSGKYVYNYNMMMKVKVSEVVDQYTRLSMNSTVELHFLPENNAVILKIVEVTFNETLRDPDRWRKLVLPSPFTEILSKHLKMPIKFIYKYGIVNTIFAKENDPDWSVNLKKSIVNLFHIDIQGKDQETMSNQLFTKPEISVFGICNTTYRMMDYAVLSATGERTKVGLNVTKFIDVSNCTLEHSEALNSVLQEPIGKMERNPIDQSAIIEYNIIGNEYKFKIEAVNATGYIFFYPFSRKDGYVASVTSQRLKLLEESGSIVKQNHPDWLENLVERGKLAIKVAPIEKPEYLWQWESQDWNKLVDLIHDKMMVFVKDFSPDLQPAAVMKNLTGDETETVLMLINSLRICKEKHLEKIWTKCSIQSRKWLLYLLSLCHTEECVKFMINKITKTNIEPELIEDYLMSESFTSRPTREQVKLFFDLCKVEKMENVPQLKTVCYVATSNLVRTLCKTKDVCKTPFQAKVLELLKKLASCKVERKECIYIENIPSSVLLSVAENIMIMPEVKPVFFTVLEKVILREDLPIEIRVKAIMACRPLIRVMPLRIRILLLKIFQDVPLDTELRIVAFSVLMENPTPAIVEICARHLIKEPSNNVRRYGIEFYKAVASTKPYYKYERKIIHEFQLSQRFFYKPLIKMLFPNFPRHVEWKYDFKPYKFSSYFVMDSIFTNASFIPRHIHSKLNVTIFGRNIPLIDAEMRMEGVQEYINRIFGYDGVLSNKKSLMDLIRKPRTKSEVEQADDAVPRPDEELKVFRQLKLFDKLYFVNYTSLTAETDLRNLFLKGAIVRAAEWETELKKGKVFSWFKPLLPVDIQYKLPTLLGVPLHYNLTALVIPRFMTVVKAEVKPNIFSLKSLFSASREFAEMGITENVSVVTRISGGIFFSLPVYDIGVRMESVMNMSTMVSGKATIDFKTMKSKFEMDLPKHERSIVSIKRELYDFIKPYPTKEIKTPLNTTVFLVDPHQMGELVILNVSKPCMGCLYEEWILRTKDGKSLTVEGNKIIPGIKATVFRVYFHGKGRRFLNIEVPKVGHVTTSRKSNCLFINRNMNSKGKVFEILYKNTTAIMLKTWVVMEKAFLPKMWTVYPQEILKEQLHDYEQKRLMWAMHKEVMLEDEKLPFKNKHVQMAYVGIMDNKLCLTPERANAELFNLTRTITYIDTLKKLTRENAFCFGHMYHVNVCMRGYYTTLKPRPILKSLLSPLEIHITNSPFADMPEKVIIKTEIQDIQKEKSVPVAMTLLTKIITKKEEQSMTKVTVQTSYDMGPNRYFRLTVTPQHSGIFFFEKMCMERVILPNNYSLWVSMEKECKIKHLKADLVKMPWEQNRILGKSMTVRLDYTAEKLPFLWQSIINTTIDTFMPVLHWMSDEVVPYFDKTWDYSWKGSALLSLHLTSNKTMNTIIKTPRNIFVYKDMTLPVFVEDFPAGSEVIPFMVKMGYLMMPYCQHSNTTFKTVDDKVYNFNLREECEHVLIRNCSANMTSFAVMVRKAEKNKVLRGVRILVDKTEVEIVPGENWKEKPEVMIDGKKIKFDLAHWKYDLMMKPLYTVMWEPKLKNLVFTDFRIGLAVIIREGIRVRTVVSPMYFNKVCGLCGNFDGETMNEFATPENHIVEDERLFGSSWILPGEECGDVCAKSRYHVEFKRKDARHCKSRIPVAQCLEGCRPVKVEKVVVPAVCVPDNEKDRTSLDDKLLHNKNVDIKDMKMTLEEMDVPVECSCGCKNKRRWDE